MESAPGDHARDHRSDLQPRIRAEISGQRQPLISEFAKAGFHRQRHRRDQTCGRHEIGIIERG